MSIPLKTALGDDNNLPDNTTMHGHSNQAALDNVSGTNTGDETVARIGVLINGATAKATPVDADKFGFADSVAGWVMKYFSWANLKAALKSYFDTLYLATVGASDLKTELKGSVAISAANVDWSAGAIFTKTLTANTTLTFSNPVLNKVITLLIDGDYALLLPTAVKTIDGTFDGSTENYIQVHCVDATTPVYWAIIKQEDV